MWSDFMPQLQNQLEELGRGLKYFLNPGSKYSSHHHGHSIAAKNMDSEALPFPGCVFLGKCIYLSVPQLTNLENKFHRHFFLTGLRERALEQSLLHGVGYTSCISHCGITNYSQTNTGNNKHLFSQFLCVRNLEVVSQGGLSRGLW